MSNAADCLPPLTNIDAYRLIVAIFFTLWNTFGLFSLLFLVFLLSRLDKRVNSAIYRLINCLHISQIIYMFSYCVVMLPCTYMDCSFYSRTVNILLSSLHTFGYYARITFDCLIAIERLSMFLCQWLHHFVDTHTQCYISIAWFVAALAVFLTNVVGCHIL